MRLVIAEKPSLARAIADALGPHTRQGDHLACPGDTLVAWCAGHILETAPPEAYDSKYKAWRLEDLPIAPADSDWKLQVSNAPLLKTLQTLLKRASRVVHAGDPDREGQLIVDQVLEFLGYQGPVDRLLVSDTNPDAVRRQLAALQPNVTFLPLSHSALGRQRADWLYGMTMTRLYTLLGRKAGYDGVLSVGRVQTPLLGLIVRRDRAIETFRPVPFFTLTATLSTDTSSFTARWQPSAELAAHLDEDGRVLHKAAAEAARSRVAGASGTVTEHTQDRKAQPPPLPYSLADLQIDAAHRLGLSAQAVLDACQALYETHRLTTYPRSDSSYLPEGHHPQAPAILAAIALQAPELDPVLDRVDVRLRSKAWNDKKVTAHHAIIPTANQAIAALNDTERAVYTLIVRRYALQFFPPHEYLQTKVTLTVAGERFAATGRQILAPGWKAAAAEPSPEPSDTPPEISEEETLPALRHGQAVTAQSVALADKLTQPPKPFNDATLMQAMVNVSAFVTDPAVKKILTDADGIGTPATRPAIIETLFQRDYISRSKKTIVATPTGRSLIDALPAIATTPDMTAVWEAALRAVVDRQQDLPSFLARVHAQLRQLVDQGRALGQIHVAKPAPATAKAASPSRRAPRARPAQR